jgi:hypothetical protein
VRRARRRFAESAATPESAETQTFATFQDAAGVLGRLNMKILKSWWWFFPALLLGGSLAFCIASFAAYMRDWVELEMGRPASGAQTMVWLLPMVVLSGGAIFASRRSWQGLAIGLVVGGAILLMLLFSLPGGGGMIG